LEQERVRPSITGRSSAVLLVDIDGLKEINDGFGHLAGDLAIEHVVNRMRAVVGDSLIARTGGDELAVVVRELEREDDAAVLAHGIRRAVASKRARLANGVQLTVTVTVGWSPVSHELTAEQTMRQADASMYEAKHRAGADAFDRVSELIVGLLDAREDGVDAAFAAGVAEVVQASAAVVAIDGAEHWWPEGEPPSELECLRKLASLARVRDEPVQEGRWRLGVPLRGDGAAVGGFAVARDYPFSKADRIALVRAGLALGQASLRLRETVDARRRIAELERLALRDETTGLANRRALLAKLEALGRPGEPLALLFVDFDGLREVNNQRSYEHGNMLLRAVAGVVEGALLPGELAGRLHGSGGDEFIIVCPQTGAGAAERRAAELELRLAPDHLPLPDDLVGLYLGASVGYALREEGEDALAFIERAACKMRERKRARKLTTA
jgi:diguanylate cyclase (GGDEF)-like protein